MLLSCDGLAYVKEAPWPNLYGPDGSPKGEPVHKMSEGMATVPDQDIEALIEAAEECPASASSSKLNNNRSALRAGSAVA